MRAYELTELRRNPDHPAQTRRNVISVLKKKYGARDDIYISMTDIDKIGINPRSEYDTPIGIYTYPLDEIVDEIKKLGDLPFAGKAPYVNVIQSDQVMELSKYTDEDLERDKKKIENLLAEKGIGPGQVEDVINDGLFTARVHNPAGFFWNITRLASKELGGRAPVKWNWLFRYLGYQAISDKNGMGIIHENEPTQAVFFTKTAFKVLGRYKNVHSYNLSTPEELKALITKNPYVIKQIRNPSEELQKIAVQKSGLALRYIKNPSEEVKKLAIQQAPAAIKYIKNPSEELQKLAINESPVTLMYIEDPSEEIKKIAVQLDGKVIKLIKDPSEEVQKLAVQENGSAIIWIKNPSEEVKKLAAEEIEKYSDSMQDLGRLLDDTK